MMAYASILVVMGLVGAVTTAMMVLAHVVRPARRGAVKDSTYESGMPAIGDARGRFNVRFYVLALLFLLFDVEVVFMWPWAVAFHRAAAEANAAVGGVTTTAGATTLAGGAMAVGPGYMLGVMAIFVGFLLVGYAYEWKKGVLTWS